MRILIIYINKLPMILKYKNWNIRYNIIMIFFIEIII